MATGSSLGGQALSSPRPEAPDPRLLQSAFVIVCVVSFLTKFEQNGSIASGLRGAIVLLIAATVMGFVVRGRAATGFFVTAALLDIAVAGLARTADDGTGLGLLGLLPVLWLGYRFGRVGTVAGIVALLVSVSVPALILDEGGDRILPVIVLPLAVSAIAVLATLMTERVDRLRSEGEMRAAQLGAIMASVSVGVLVLDRQGQIATINPVASELMALAYPTDPYQGLESGAHSAFAIDGVTPLTDEQRPTVRATRGEEFDDFECWIGPEPATRRAVSITSRRLSLVDESPGGQVLVIHDITELLLATQARDRFLRAASHELRTPLMIVLNHADLLSARPEIERGDFPEVAAITRGTERLSRLVGDILRLAEPPADRATVEPGPLDITFDLPAGDEVRSSS